MAVVRWLGGAAAVAQITYVTPAGTIESGDIFRAQIGNKVLSYTSTATTIASIVTGFTAAWNASTQPEFAEVTATASGSTAIALTADTPGKPFTVNTTTVEANGSTSDSQTFTTTTAGTANKGPNSFTSSENYDTGIVPVSSDALYIENGAVAILYDLDSTGVTLDELHIAQNYIGTIGLPERNSGGYREYRSTHLRIGSDIVRIGYGTGSGSGRIKLDLGTPQTAVSIYNSGATLETGVETIQILASNSSNSLQVLKGSVGSGIVTNTSSQWGTVSVSYTEQQNTDSKVRFGSGVSLATVSQYGGEAETNSNITTLTQQAGTHKHQAGTVGTLNLHGGTCVYNSTGTITAAHVASGGLLDLSKDTRRLTVSALDLYTGFNLQDPNKRINNFTADLNRCKLSDGTINIGTNIRITTTDPA